MRTYVSAILVSCLIPGFAFAQGEPISKLERGAKIRINCATLPESEKLGRFDSINADTVRFRPDQHPVTRSVLLGNISSIEVSRQIGTRRSEYAGNRGLSQLGQGAHPRFIELLPNVLVIGQRPPQANACAGGLRSRLNDRADSCVYFAHACPRDHITNIVLANSAAGHDGDAITRLIDQTRDDVDAFQSRGCAA